MDALYIHIPFCKTICSYCDFYKMVAKEHMKDEYVAYLQQELLSYRHLYHNLNTIYIGGGTPSSLAHPILEQLLKSLKQNINIDELLEYTIECNIEDINHDFIRLCHQYGINRFSIGVQSFNESKLSVLNRKANLLDVLAKLDMIRDICKKNVSINIDLMYAIAGETIEMLNEDIDAILMCAPDHISIYSLILEERTLLHHLFQMGKYQKFDEDLESDMFFLIRNRLIDAGYLHYETSNFAKLGKMAIHNTKYWNHTPYLGIGASASSFDGTTRRTNPKNLHQYYHYVKTNDQSLCEVVQLNSDDLMKEMIIVGLRKTEGISIDLFYERFSISIFEKFPIIDWLLEVKWLEEDNRFLRLPTDKLYLANAILEKFI